VLGTVVLVVDGVIFGCGTCIDCYYVLIPNYITDGFIGF
jgi:hypothetical protein